MRRLLHALRRLRGRARSAELSPQQRVGRAYERYIGHLYEEDGWHVEFDGATKGFCDLGRDLIATRGDRRHIVQCKCWAKDKLIDESYVFKFFSSIAQFIVSKGMMQPGQDLLTTLDEQGVCAILVTTAKLSDQARQACRILGVRYREGVLLKPYPMIKCNVGASGSRIYHRPNDEFYDRIKIEPEKGEFYAWTEREARKAGFRRARRRKRRFVRTGLFPRVVR